LYDGACEHVVATAARRVHDHLYRLAWFPLGMCKPGKACHGGNGK